MPTYQYSCTDCGHFFEQFQSFSDDSLTVCPVCDGKLRKVFNAVGVVFKGSGFYRNDSRSPDTKASSDGASKPSEKTPEKSAAPAKSDSSSTASGSSSSPAPSPA
ncbi:MAG: Zinc ribbon domain protein [Marmoricola sp.]|nr:Zinc ribbon domain protein [Marmoricola sp.]